MERLSEWKDYVRKKVLNGCHVTVLDYRGIENFEKLNTDGHFYFSPLSS